MNVTGSVLAALAAAAVFALSAVAQQVATRSVSAEQSMRLRLLLSLLHRPLWIASVGLLVSGYALQGVALALGPVSLVQPVVATELAFAIPLGMRLRHRRPGRREWLGIAAVVVGISLFLLGASPTEGNDRPAQAVWLLVLVPAGSAIAALFVAAGRTRGPARARLLGAAAGLCFGILAVLTKATIAYLESGVATTFGHWQPYGVIAVGVFALVCSQSAYQAAPLAYSLPMLAVLEPVSATVIGMTALNEELRITTSALALAMVGASAACSGIVLLARSPMVHAIYESDVASASRRSPRPD